MANNNIVLFNYLISNDDQFINENIEKLLNSNNLFSEQMKKMDIYRTEFYNLFLDPKTQWLICNKHVRLYVKIDYTVDDNTKYSHYVPIGFVREANPLGVDDDLTYFTDDELKGKHLGFIVANIYFPIVDKFKGLLVNDSSKNRGSDINTDLYHPGYISCGDDIIAITLTKTDAKFNNVDAFHIYCNKLVKFAKNYISKNKLI